ncbi:hypothetical protein VTK56DRAFT_8890 [Thermocarpiscus australiensis]
MPPMHYYASLVRSSGPPLDRDKQVIAERLRSLYEQGVPFFTKRVFREVLRQLDHCRANPRPVDDANCHIISIPAVDGTVVETKLETGRVRPLDDKTESVVMDPHLEYYTFHHLYDEALSRPTDFAYCPTQLIYPMKQRHVSTETFLDPFELEAPEAVQRAFEAGIKQWEASEDCRRLRAVLETALLPRVNSIVAFACSTMSAKKGELRTIYQHALILTMRDILSSRRCEEKPEISCFAQDPIYTDIDEEVLRRAGVAVLQDPRGFLEVDDQSLVISFAPNIPVRQIIADIARPAVLICDRVKTDAEAVEYWRASGFEYNPGRVTDPESPRLLNMVRKHYHEPISLGPEEWFGNAAVYIRRD